MSPAVMEDLMVIVKESIQRQHLTGHSIELNCLFSSFVLPYLRMCLERIQSNEKDSQWLGMKTGYLVCLDGYSLLFTDSIECVYLNSI